MKLELNQIDTVVALKRIIDAFDQGNAVVTEVQSEALLAAKRLLGYGLSEIHFTKPGEERPSPKPPAGGG